MRAALVMDFGGPEVVQIADVEIPQPAAGQVRIKVAAATLNPADAAMRSGAIADIPRPFGLGWDAAGTIDATGPHAPCPGGTSNHPAWPPRSPKPCHGVPHSPAAPN